MPVEKVCKFAKKLERRRGAAILCFKGRTEKEVLAFVNFPDRISNIPKCVATHTFSTGHATPDSYVKESEMYDCLNRKPGE